MLYVCKVTNNQRVMRTRASKNVKTKTKKKSTGSSSEAKTLKKKSTGSSARTTTSKKKSGSYVTGAKTSRNSFATETLSGSVANTTGLLTRQLHNNKTKDSYAQRMMALDRASGFRSSYQNPGPSLQGYTGAMEKKTVRSLSGNKPKATLQGRGSANAQIRAKAAATPQSRKSKRRGGR